MHKRNVACAALALGALFGGEAFAEGVKMRVSLDTTATHIRTIQVGRYLDAVKAKSKGSIEPELFHSGQLFRDRDVGKAIRQGGAEMAVPGTWVLTGFDPNIEFSALPALYGQPREVTYRISDGEVGQIINKSLEQKLKAKVLGKWLDLGSSHTYAVKPLEKPSDMEGMKVRTSGGHGQFVRVKFFGGLPNFTAWPDVPLALSQGNFDALISTNESIASAKLWESGIKYALQDYHFYAQYVPLVSETFFNKLTAEQRAVLNETWAEMIDGFRDEANAAQAKAAETMAANGVKVTVVDKSILAEARKRMLVTEDELVKELKFDPKLVAKINAVVNASN
jgi:C4-dicarboxylate-binding protein DctP